MTWTSDVPPPSVRPGPLGICLALLRGLLMALWLALGLSALLSVRLIERPLCGPHRPVTPWIATGTCRAALWIAGLRLHLCGSGPVRHGAIVANHSSWLDILVLNAVAPVYFVSKAEVAHWPGIGLLARATGTVFIDRHRRDAARQTALFRDRLTAGHRLLFFPEGTSTDGRQVLPFKPTLFEAFFHEGLRARLSVQPVSVIYDAPPGEDRRFYGWWGDMALGPHLLAVLSARRRGCVRVVYHPPIRVAETAGRKALAQACEAAIRDGLERGKKRAETG